MDEEVIATTTACVNLGQLAKAVTAVCAMIEAAIEQYDDTATSFNDGLLALSNEIKTHAGYIYTVAIKSSDDVSLTTKISIKSEIDRLDALVDAFEQVQKKKSSNKKGDSNE